MGGGCEGSRWSAWDAAGCRWEEPPWWVFHVQNWLTMVRQVMEAHDEVSRGFRNQLSYNLEQGMPPRFVYKLYERWGGAMKSHHG